MSELFGQLAKVNTAASVNKEQIVSEIQELIIASGYNIVELNGEKPWGAYFKFHRDDADEFVREFFPGLSLAEARLGNDSLELSPKILLVSPNQRLSWQYHHNRAERWAFLNDGFYYGSMTDEEGERQVAHAGDVVQFKTAQRHRLVGAAAYTLVAEIWQHTNISEPSTEDDIVRLQDDYARS